jgi:two-component system sensor histidine kinase EvgS
VISEVARKEVPASESPDTLFADILDTAIVASVQAYVDARDLEGRRAQAESIGFVTHELRNPLATAMTAVEVLRRQASPEQERLFDALDRSHRRLLELVEGVLSTQRLEAGHVQSRPRPTTLGAILDPALEAARAVAARKGLGFHTRYDADLAVAVDPDLTRSAIQNLADNAAKYTSVGQIDVTVEPRPTEIVVHVRDTCPGLTPEELRTIFQPFRRGRSAEAGTGLGLAIARRSVEAQGGTIAAESPGPEGCHFWITLPVSGDRGASGG